MTMLTPHFTLEEFTDSQTAARKGLHNVPPLGSPERANLQRAAETMEKVRAILGDKPILISSGYRSPKVNAAVGGAESSAHMSGLAVDFSAPGAGTPLQICRKLEPHMKALSIDQLIHEFNQWVHLGLSSDPIKARQMTLTINQSGTRQGFV
jgi:zinc D-Ala-D-Ala carboxypeptidase